MFLVFDMFPHTTVSEKAAKNLLICFLVRQVQKPPLDINYINSTHVETVVLMSRVEK